MIRSFVQAFVRGDARAIARLFTEEEEAVDLDGDAIPGGEAIEAHHAGKPARPRASQFNYRVIGTPLEDPGLNFAR